jgi:hypothetical protein
VIYCILSLTRDPSVGVFYPSKLGQTLKPE